MFYIITKQYNNTCCKVIYLGQNKAAAHRKFKNFTGVLPAESRCISVNNCPIMFHQYLNEK